MDVESLINEIHKRPALWDQKHRNHHNRFVLDKLWSEVAGGLKTTPTVVRYKWKTIRDKCRSIFISLPESRSGNVKLTDYQGEWKHFKSLFFLKDQFIARKYKGNDEDDVSESGTPSPQDPPSEGPAKFASTKYSSKRSLCDALLRVEEKKFLYLQEKTAKMDEVDDDDLSFFKSLLPHVRTFSACDKMDYRMSIIRITQDYLQQSQSVTPVSNWSVDGINEAPPSNEDSGIQSDPSNIETCHYEK